MDLRKSLDLAGVPSELFVLPGKSGPNGNWLSACTHMVDVAHCILWLLDVRYPTLYKSSGLSEDEFRRYAVLSGLDHDIGKLIVAFLRSILRSLPEHRSLLSRYGVPVPDGPHMAGRTRHGLAGETILRSLGYPPGFASLAGAHHGMPTPFDINVRTYMENHAVDYWGNRADRPFGSASGGSGRARACPWSASCPLPTCRRSFRNRRYSCFPACSSLRTGWRQIRRISICCPPTRSSPVTRSVVRIWVLPGRG